MTDESDNRLTVLRRLADEATRVNLRCQRDNEKLPDDVQKLIEALEAAA